MVRPARSFAAVLGSIGRRFDAGELHPETFVAAVLAYLPRTPSFTQDVPAEHLRLLGDWCPVPVPAVVAARTFAVGLELGARYHVCATTKSECLGPSDAYRTLRAAQEPHSALHYRSLGRQSDNARHDWSKLEWKAHASSWHAVERYAVVVALSTKRWIPKLPQPDLRLNPDASITAVAWDGIHFDT